jgi:hypothetical protein
MMDTTVSGYACSCRYGHLKEKRAANMISRKRHLLCRLFR